MREGRGAGRAGGRNNFFQINIFRSHRCRGFDIRVVLGLGDSPGDRKGRGGGR